MRRLGFSLVELLTIIAIIIVLAGILFPVFRQAAAAQGNHESAFNLKKIARAVDQYGEDADGGIIIIANGRYRNLLNIRDGVLNTYEEPRTDLWPLLLLPYLKKRELYVDPERGDEHNIYAFPAHASIDTGYDATGATYRNQSRFPMFALNYLFLSPFAIPASKLSDATPTDYMVGQGHKFDEADDPSNTVFFTVAQRGYIPTTTTDVLGELDTTRGFFGVNAPGLWDLIVPTQTDGVIVFWDGTNCSGDWCGSDINPVQPGVQTSENFFYRHAGSTGNNVMFLDGHVSFKNASQLAAGTDYLTASPSDGGTGYFGGGAHITNKSQYLWNLNDYYYGL